MQHIFDELKLQNTTNLHKYIKNVDINFLPLRVNKSLHGMEYSPHSIFIINNKPIILLFDKHVETEKVFQQCWNFSESPIIIIENQIDFDIYNGYEHILKDGNFLLETLDKNSLDYISILSGTYIEKTKFKKQDNRVDKILLKNIKDAREEIIYNLVNSDIQEKRIFNKKNKAYEYKNLDEVELAEFLQMKNISNALIGRIIFIRYLIDRKVSIGFRKEKEKLSNDDFIKILGSYTESYELFRYLKSDKGFNGDWFPILKNEEIIVKDLHLKILQNLINGYDFDKKQGTLFNFYNFSIIPIEFISNVYESFIGEEEQSKNGAYYTPTFLVDYILKYTIDDFFKKNPNKYDCKVLDPACGSGIFLVETLRKLINQFEKIKKRKILPKEIVKLVKDNIYAIDKDRNAILISVFSLYLTMIDYQNPKDIESFKFPYLMEGGKNPNPNFFEDDFFNTDAKYNKILKNENIDFIIGNPPYGKGTIQKDSFVERYIKNNNFNVGNRDIVQPFMLRIKDFSHNSTKVGFIITSKILYNLKAREFRINHFFKHFKVEHILELSSVRKEIFENADVPVSIIFYKNSKEKEVLQNEINYISIKPSPFFNSLKLLFITKNDYKKVLQSKLLEHDYLWKILLYGSYLDFNFIKRLNTNYNKIQKLIDEKQLLKYQGFKRNDQNVKVKTNTETLKNLDFIDTNKKNLKSFYISNNLEKFNYDNVAYIYKENGEIYDDLYKAPALLFTGGLNNQLKQTSAISYRKAIFTSSVVALKTSHTNKNKNILKIINGLFYSKYFAYFLLQTASSPGVEREECDDYEKLSLPYTEDKKIISIVTKIENIQKDYYECENILQSNTYERDLQKSMDDLDTQILKAFNLSEEEHSLIDYTTNIIIPLVIQKKYNTAFERLNYQDKRLEDYVKIFTEHYIKIYEQNNMHFKAEISYNDYAICIYFKVLHEKPKETISWEKEINIQNFVKLSGNQPLENLFIQKDIKGFETDGFYVIKPNEYKNWHKAIGYLDFYEFRDAILKAGKNKWKK